MIRSGFMKLSKIPMLDRIINIEQCSIAYDYHDEKLLSNKEILDSKTEELLLLDEQDQGVLDFVKDSTRIFDESHNWIHALNVAYNSTKIRNTKQVLYLALLHDVCDHKYPESVPREVLSKWIHDNLRDYKNIDKLIDKVSFSKQKNFEDVHPALQAVRDGDRMEAIGEVGIKRVVQYSIAKKLKGPDDVIKHCFDKLLRLVPEGYIINKTPEVIRRHNVLVEYVNKNSDRKVEFI
jgi:HD superfamily phosphodiesterase